MLTEKGLHPHGVFPPPKDPNALANVHNCPKEVLSHQRCDGEAQTCHDRKSLHSGAHAALWRLHAPATHSTSVVHRYVVRRPRSPLRTFALGPNLQVLMVGGADEEHDPIDSVEEYDPSTELWAELAELPFHRNCFPAAVLV